MVLNNQKLMPIEKPGSIRNLGAIDNMPIKKIVDQLSSEVWAKEDKRKENNFFCFHHTQHIILRFTEGNRDPRQFYSNPIWCVCKPILLPVMQQVTKEYGFRQPEYPKVMFARLEVGQHIDRHRDGAGSNLHTHKIHIPLYTNPQVQFLVNDRPYYLEEGFAYEVNNIVPHGVINNGSADRIHFIFEVFDSSYN